MRGARDRQWYVYEEGCGCKWEYHSTDLDNGMIYPHRNTECIGDVSGNTLTMMGDWYQDSYLAYYDETRELHVNLIRQIAEKLDERAAMEKIGDVSREV